MKLKKIAALALAGVMAVSMLAGCATKPGTDNGEGEGEGTVVTTGYSAELGKAVELTTDQAKYISFADNAADQAALEDAVKGLSYGTLANFGNWAKATEITSAKQTYSDMDEMVENFKDATKLTGSVDSKWLSMAGFANDNNQQNTPDLRRGAIFAVNGGVDSDAAVKSIASVIKAQCDAMEDDNSGASNTGSSYKYSYVVSVSVANKAQSAAYQGTAASTTFIAVTVSRTVTAG